MRKFWKLEKDITFVYKEIDMVRLEQMLEMLKKGH